MYESRNIFDRFIEILADIDNKKNIIVKNYQPETKVEVQDKQRIVSILNKIKYDSLDYYLDLSITFELHKSFESNKIDSILNKYSKDDSPIDEIIDQMEMIKNANKTSSEETITERVKLRRQRKKEKD